MYLIFSCTSFLFGPWFAFWFFTILFRLFFGILNLNVNSQTVKLGRMKIIDNLLGIAKFLESQGCVVSELSILFYLNRDGSSEIWDNLFKMLFFYIRTQIVDENGGCLNWRIWRGRRIFIIAWWTRRGWFNHVARSIIEFLL